MTDMVADLRHKAAQASPAYPHVRVTGAFLSEVANELERLQRVEQERLKAMLFDRENAQ